MLWAWPTYSYHYLSLHVDQNKFCNKTIHLNPCNHNQLCGLLLSWFWSDRKLWHHCFISSLTVTKQTKIICCVAHSWSQWSVPGFTFWWQWLVYVFGSIGVYVCVRVSTWVCVCWQHKNYHRDLCDIFREAPKCEILHLPMLSLLQICMLQSTRIEQTSTQKQKCHLARLNHTLLLHYRPPHSK